MDLWILLFVLFGLFALNVPVAFAMMVTALVGLLGANLGTLDSLPQKMIAGINSFLLLTVPFFILAGLLMNHGGVTDRIFRFAKSLVGHIRGGLGQVNVVASIIFAGSSGSSQAEAAGLGTVQIGGMKKEGYDPALAAAITGAASTIGPIIPPSIVLVVYGALGGASIGALLIGGILPGLLMGLSLMITIYIIAWKNGYKVSKRSSLKEIFISFRKSFFALLAPLVLIGGIFEGAFTPSEAGAIAALYSLIIAAFVYRELKWKDIPKILIELVVATSGIMLIIGAASSLGYVIAIERIPQQLAELIFTITEQKWLILLLINLIVLVAGMFLEGLAILAILIPIFIPIAHQLDINLVHFGVMICLNIMIGTLTPPVGVVAYIVCQIADVSYARFLKAAWPFLLALFIALMVVTFNEDVVLILPKLLLG